MEETAVIISICSFILILLAFTKVKIFFIGKGILLHIIRFIALVIIVYGLILMFEENEGGGLFSGIGAAFDSLLGFNFVLLGFLIILSSQLSMETHLQIEENKHNISRLGIPEAEKKDNTTIERVFIPPSEKLQVFCPSCKTVISNQSESCPECNKSLFTAKLKRAECLNCGQSRESSKVKFCTSCGTQF